MGEGWLLDLVVSGFGFRTKMHGWVRQKKEQTILKDCGIPKTQTFKKKYGTFSLFHDNACFTH